MQKIKLLITDDNPVFRIGLAKLLSDDKIFNCITLAANGIEALNYLEKYHHDIIITEVKMQPVNGIEIASIVNQKFPKTRTIAISRCEDEATVMQMIENGVFGYLLKNSDACEILKAIIAVSNGRKYFSQPISCLMANNLFKNGKHNSLKNIQNELKGDRFRDVLFLMCHELSTNEIAKLLCLSPRTIEYYRNRAKELTCSRNYIGVMKYAFQWGILEDVALKTKWKKAISQPEIQTPELA